MGRGPRVHAIAPAPSLENPTAYVETNINGTMNLLNLARDYNIKQFVFASSSSVYGINSKVPFAEDDKIDQPQAIADVCEDISILYIL